MKLLLPIIPFLSCVPNHQVVDASAGLFTYYEDPFLPSQDNPNLIFELGPARWRNLNLLNNECGGNGRKLKKKKKKRDILLFRYITYINSLY